MYELKKPDIQLTKGSLEYDLTYVKSQSEQLAEFLKGSVVTEDTVKENKKLISNANKVIKALEDERKSIKKALLEPYGQFEKEIKEIKLILDDANLSVKTQVDHFEDIERSERVEAIHVKYDLKSQAYAELSFTNFDDFFTESLANKSATNKAIDEAILNYFESTRKDYDMIQMQEDSSQILAEYLITKDLHEAMVNHQTRQNVIKIIGESAVENQIDMFEELETHEFFKISTKDVKSVEVLLTNYNIEFSIVE